MKLTIGNVTLDNNLILALVAEATDLPLCLLCKEQGCGLTCTEMVSTKAIYYKNKNTAPLLKAREEERPIAMQLFGSDPVTMSKMAKQIESGPYNITDVSMGCPVPGVMNNEKGSVLMKSPKLVEEIFTAMVKALKESATVKFRRDFDETYVNAVRIAKIAEGYSMTAVVIHGRTRGQYHSGRAGWKIIRQVKGAVKIPVIGNGDIFTPQDTRRMLEETGCDGLMIARGAEGNPWIPREINYYLDTGELLPQSGREEIREMLLRHASLQVEYKGEYLGIRRMRKHAAWYTAGLSHSPTLQDEVNQAKDYEDFKTLIMHKM